MEGNLHDFSATEILQLLASQRKTGCLSIEHRSGQRTVWVLEGRIVSTRGDVPLEQDMLFRFLRRVRRLSKEQLQGVATLHAESKRDLEDLIVQGRYMEADELGGLIERQILGDLADLIEWSEGRYTFDADRKWRQPVIVRLSIEASLIEAARRADERKRFDELFQDGRQVVSVRDLPDPDAEIADEESEMFGIIDGQHTVSEVIAAAPLSDYEASETLQRMIEAGWIEFLGRREVGAPVPPAGAKPPPPPAAVSTPAVKALVRSGSWMRDVAVGVLCLVGLVGVGLMGRALRSPERPGAVSVFEAARIGDVRLALELYRRERGSYPDHLERLVEDGWLEARQLEIEGRRLQYRSEPARKDYTLDLP